MFGMTKSQITITVVLLTAVIVYLIVRSRNSGTESSYGFYRVPAKWKPGKTDMKDELRSVYNWMPPNYPESGYVVPAFYNNAYPVDMSRMFTGDAHSIEVRGLSKESKEV